MNGVATPHWSSRLSFRLESLAVLILLCVIMAVVSPYFLSVSNILNIFMATATIGVLAIGVFALVTVALFHALYMGHEPTRQAISAIFWTVIVCVGWHWHLASLSLSTIRRPTVLIIF